MSITSTDLCGQQIGGGSTTFTFQPTVNVPATDPTDPGAGATVVMICVQAADSGGGDVNAISIVDDATGTACSAPIVNSYVEGGAMAVGGGFCSFYTFLGIIYAPLTSGLSNITVTLNSSADFVAVIGRVYTGVAIDQVNLPDAASVLNSSGIGSGGPRGIAELDDGSNPGVDLIWNYFGGGGSVDIITPLGATPSTWQWALGDLAIYMQGWANDFTNGAWTWTNPDIVTQAEYDDVAMAGLGSFTSIVYAEQVITGLIPDVGEDLSGTWQGDDPSSASGGFALVTGDGPTCETPPPTGNPVFNHRFRAVD